MLHKHLQKDRIQKQSAKAQQKEHSKLPRSSLPAALKHIFGAVHIIKNRRRGERQHGRPKVMHVKRLRKCKQKSIVYQKRYDAHCTESAILFENLFHNILSFPRKKVFPIRQERISLCEILRRKCVASAIYFLCICVCIFVFCHIGYPKEFPI